jgi:hypothetical protein
VARKTITERQAQSRTLYAAERAQQSPNVFGLKARPLVFPAMEETDYCNRVGEVELEHLAGKWLSDLRLNVPPEESDPYQAVVSMNFSAPPEIQWKFILIAVSLSESDDELS